MFDLAGGSGGVIAEMLEGLKEIQEFKKGKIKLKTTRLSAPPEPKAIRPKEPSQWAFKSPKIGH